MAEELLETIQRWTAKCRSALVLSIPQGQTSVQGAARKHYRAPDFPRTRFNPNGHLHSFDEQNLRDTLRKYHFGFREFLVTQFLSGTVPQHFGALPPHAPGIWFLLCRSRPVVLQTVA